MCFFKTHLSSPPSDFFWIYFFLLWHKFGLSIEPEVRELRNPHLIWGLSRSSESGTSLGQTDTEDRFVQVTQAMELKEDEGTSNTCQMEAEKPCKMWLIKAR